MSYRQQRAFINKIISRPIINQPRQTVKDTELFWNRNAPHTLPVCLGLQSWTYEVRNIVGNMLQVFS